MGKGTESLTAKTTVVNSEFRCFGKFSREQ
jgi:hypothetical protein